MFQTYPSSPAPQELFSAQFAPSDEYVAVGDAKGAVNVFKARTGERSPFTLQAGKLPIMDLAWRPEAAHISGKNVLLVCRTDGSLSQYSALSGKCQV